MSLSSLHLDAFISVARELNFSRAAEKLFVTQSALSQRIKGLEEELGLSLFIRDPAGVMLTETGETLLRYCQVKDQLEEDFLSGITSQKTGELAGVVRIAGYSSVMRSVIIPALAPLLREHPRIKCEFMVREMAGLPLALARSEADLIILDYKFERTNLEAVVLGQENYVVIEGKAFKGPKDVYLDHNPDDRATEIFFRSQKGKMPHYKRGYMGDVYGILEGVSQGLGRAVMSEHLISPKCNLKILREFKAVPVDVVLHYHKQPFYTKLQKVILESLSKNAPHLL